MTPCLTSNLMSVTSWSANHLMVTFAVFADVLRAGAKEAKGMARKMNTRNLKILSPKPGGKIPRKKG
jgi:hypothetical protein